MNAILLCQCRNNVGIVDGLTLDVENDLIYWTDVTSKSIERANLNGHSRRTLLGGLDKPRAIVLYKTRRFVILLRFCNFIILSFLQGTGDEGMGVGGFLDYRQFLLVTINRNV